MSAVVKPKFELSDLDYDRDITDQQIYEYALVTNPEIPGKRLQEILSDPQSGLKEHFRKQILAERVFVAVMTARRKYRKFMCLKCNTKYGTLRNDPFCPSCFTPAPGA